MILLAGTPEPTAPAAEAATPGITEDGARARYGVRWEWDAPWLNRSWVLTDDAAAVVSVAGGFAGPKVAGVLETRLSHERFVRGGAGPLSQFSLRKLSKSDVFSGARRTPRKEPPVKIAVSLPSRSSNSRSTEP